MKTQFLKLSKSISLAFFIIVITASCSSNESDPDPAIVEQEALNKFSVLINGTQYTANFVSGIETTKIFTIVTTDANNEGINIYLPSNNLGTYTITDGIFDDFNAGYTESNSAFSISSSGSLTITDKIQVDAITVRIKGTFAFSLVDTNRNIVYELTKGSFNLEYLSI